MPSEDELEIGQVNGYFPRIGVAGLDLSNPLRVGDLIHIKGHTTDLEQVVESMQIEHELIQEAKAGDNIAIKVADRCRRGDRVFKVVD